MTIVRSWRHSGILHVEYLQDGEWHHGRFGWRDRSSWATLCNLITLCFID